MQKIIFKCDDLNSLSSNVLRLDDFVQKNNLKITWGIIGNSLEKKDPLYFKWIKSKNKTLNYEFWNHGYSHNSEPYEFQGQTVKFMINSIKRTQYLAKKNLGITLRGFGAPANHIDNNTSKALKKIKEIKYWYYGLENNTQKILNRSIEIEFPFGKPDFEKFKFQYENIGKNKELIIYQLHPNMWNDFYFSEFERIVNYLKSQNVQFVLPSSKKSQTHMQKLLVNILCGLIPSKSLRHKIRNRILMDKKNILENIKPNKIEKDYTEILNEIKNYTKENYWANVFHDTTNNSSWFLTKNLSPGRWAVSYVVLYIIYYRVLDEIKPQNILECGLGQSSKLMIQYADKYKAKLTICEHNQVWADFFYKQFPTAKNYIQFMKTEKQKIVAPYESNTYVDFENSINGKKYDFIFVDGPEGSKNFSRPQLLSMVNHLKSSFVIMLDDMNRLGEIQTFNKLKELLRQENIDFCENIYHSDKSVGLICSPDLRYLTTL